MQASVVVPVFNSPEIENCLKSLLSQDFRDFEIIVVDDGSTDGTSEIVDKFQVRFIRQSHLGPAAARNLGATNALGEIVVFTDSDCAAETNWLSKMLEPFGDPKIVGVQGRYKTKQHGLIARFVQYEIEERYERMAKYEYIDFVGSYSAAYRKDIFLKEGGFDESFLVASGEDPELSFRLADKGYKMVFNPDAIVYHRHPNSLGRYLRQKFYRACWRVPLYKKNKRKAVSDSYTSQILKIQIAIFYLLLPAIISQRTFLALISFFFISTLPSSIKILSKDRNVAVAAPFLIFFRAIAFALGLVWGAIKNKAVTKAAQL